MRKVHLASVLTGGLLALGTLPAQPSWQVRYLTPPPVPIWQRTSDVVYGGNTNPWTFQWENLKLDIYEPAGDTATDRPVYLHVHGGQFVYGTKNNGEAELLCKTFCDLGYVGVSIDYRLANTPNVGGLGPTTCAEDVKAAVRFMRKNASLYRIDPNRIMIGGDSSGGQSCYQAAYSTWEGNSGNPGFSGTANCVLAICSFSFNTPDNANIPFIAVHGTLDQHIPFSWLQWFASEATRTGIPNTVVAVNGAYHMPYYVWDQWKTDLWGASFEQLRLAERSGLVVNNEYGSLGKVTFSASGWQDRTSVVFVSPKTHNLPIPGFGTIGIDPATSVLLWSAVHPGAQYTTTLNLPLQLQPGLAGTIHSQAFEFHPITFQLARITNTASITFP